MPIPKEILDVERPVNTIVIAYGKDKNHYAVRKRIGCRNDNGRHLPVNGPTIGHIINGKYVPLDVRDVSRTDVDLKDWANVVLCDQLFHNMLDELQKVYSYNNAVKVYVITILRVCFPGIKDYELQEAYEESFLSELYHDVPLSKNTVSAFMNDLGKAYSRVVQFMRNRTAAVKADDHLLIDGTLKSDESECNSLSGFSRKARVKGTRDISVLYAFDLETMTPVCSKCFPGNMIDAVSYDRFIDENHIRKGLIVGDKGFPASSIRELVKKYPNLHFMNPVKRNCKLIEKYDLYSYDGVLKDCEGITYKIAYCKEEKKWLYSFRDARMAAKEEHDYLERAKKKPEFNNKEFEKKQKEFGTVVLECDEKMTAEIAYRTYAERWNIELVMRFYKSACEFDETREHDDYSVLGSEFCDFLATVLTYRLLHRFDDLKLLEQMTYKKIMAVLKRAKKINLPEEGWTMVKMNPSQVNVLTQLGLLGEVPQPVKRKRGRPRKSAV